MFYSHEVLTSRRYGVATVWLVATLGQKSALKKVSRKAILDVDVAKACETILAPDAPLALRLQSNLLFGLTRVYSQQCGYVLTDVEAARNNMRQVVRLMKQTNLEKEGGNKAQPDQLMLQDDPSFLPDLNLMPIDLDNLNFDVNQDTQGTLSPNGSQYTASQHSIGGLMLPPSQSSFAGGPVGGLDLLSVRGDYGTGIHRRTDMVLEDDDLGFSIEADGTFRDEEQQPGEADRPVSTGADGLSLHSKQRSPPRPPINPDDGFAPIQDDFMFDDRQNVSDTQPLSSSGLTTAAAVRRPEPKKRKPIPLDTATTLHNSHLSRWSAEYLQNMREATKQKMPAKLAAIARKNATHWVLGADSILGEGVPGPLDMFSGARLLETFRGERKHEREDEESSQSGRRIRQRTDTSSGEAGRGLADDDGFMPIMDDDTIEQGREAPTPLDDRHGSSIFPWNQSAGSRRPTDAGHPTSASYGGEPQPNFLSRRGSRLTSASPLIGRGEMGNVDDDLQLPGSDYAMGGMNDDEQFELFGPAAQVNTQTAVQSQWQRTVLGSESANFLSFVQNAIDEADQLRGNEPDAVNDDDDDDDVPLKGSIDFETLLPTDTNSQIVAAQAFLHVLTLGTKSMLSASQAEPFGSITLRAIAV